MTTPQRVCTFPGCGKKHLAHGLCEAHDKQRRKGNELKPLRPRAVVPKGAACEFSECGRPRCAQGLCKTHYRQFERHGRDGLIPIGSHHRATTPTPCTGPECTRPAQKRGVCGGHYAQMQRGGPLKPIRTKKPCAFEECDLPATSRGLCNGHAQQRDRGVALKPLWDRVARPRLNSDGYVVVMDRGHPNARKSGYLFQHVQLMSNHLGRPLYGDENVHHRNGVKHDNRIENLELWSTSQPCGQLVADKVAWARELLNRYADAPADVLERPDLPLLMNNEAGRPTS